MRRIDNQRATPPSWVVWLVVACLALTVATVLLTTIVPNAVVPDDLTKDDHRRLITETAVRNTIVQALAGLVIVVGLCLTARSLYISRETHLTDRLTKAVDQLGHENPAVRLGGVYSLQRLARNSPSDKAMVADLLSGYLQAHAGKTGEPPEPDTIAPDIQTALTVLVGLHS